MLLLNYELRVSTGLQLDDASAESLTSELAQAVQRIVATLCLDSRVVITLTEV